MNTIKTSLSLAMILAMVVEVSILPVGVVLAQGITDLGNNRAEVAIYAGTNCWLSSYTKPALCVKASWPWRGRFEIIGQGSMWSQLLDLKNVGNADLQDTVFVIDHTWTRTNGVWSPGGIIPVGAHYWGLNVLGAGSGDTWAIPLGTVLENKTISHMLKMKLKEGADRGSFWIRAYAVVN